jgi:hypothetical protein
MILPTITLICALSISATAAYFSIIGLATMFPGSKEAIILMGAVLEVGKIIAAIWLHTNWKTLSKLIKFYLSFSVLVLMLITSMGIFGFLSKSYIVHEAESDKELAQIAQVDNQILREKELIKKYEESIKESEQKQNSASQTKVNFIEIEEARIGKISEISKQSINTENENIKRWRERMQVMDEAMALVKSKTGLFSNTKKKIEELEAEQQEEREDLKSKISSAESRIQLAQEEMQKNIKDIQSKIEDFQNAVIKSATENNASNNIQLLINDSQNKIDTLELQKFEMQKKVSALEVEVGPVKYIVELFGDLGNKNIGLGTAVRLVIIALIFVFDPLAVILVVVSVGYFTENKKTTKTKPKEIKETLPIKEKIIVQQTNDKQISSLSEEISKIKQDIESSKKIIPPKVTDESNINWSK